VTVRDSAAGVLALLLTELLAVDTVDRLIIVAPVLGLGGVLVLLPEGNPIARRSAAGKIGQAKRAPRSSTPAPISNVPQQVAEGKRAPQTDRIATFANSQAVPVSGPTATRSPSPWR
jgi:hypothetical protein